ncbi:MAG: DUF5320 domain-containing protein [Syntrophomonadaceae bacterium]|nr:DUF5320 domain-containing protein [Syntrophomonadaceae bacterium]
MPGRNGTGPMGRGAMTGRGLGNCMGAGYGIARLGRRAMGRGLWCSGIAANAARYGAGLVGRGMGMAMGLGRNFEAQTSDPQTEKEILQNRKDLLEEQLQYINR